MLSEDPPREMDVSFPASPPGQAWALGNFDGVHLGHASLLKAAAKHGLPVAAVTFEPHPLTLLFPERPPFRLTSPEIKRRLLLEAGAEPLVADFTERFSRMSARDFVERVIIPAKPAVVAVGEGFRFGADRTGDGALLSEYAQNGAFRFELVPLAYDAASGARISSGRLREALAAGDTETYRRLAGRDWFTEGRVIAGAARARSLGFPTANVKLSPNLLTPAFGVYAGVTEAEAFPGRLFPAVANIGMKPTFVTEAVAPLLEVHLLPPVFPGGDLYGQVLRFHAAYFLRPERAFPSADALRAAVFVDMDEARFRLEPLFSTPRSDRL